MPSILVIGDLHIRTTRPRCRTEADFQGACLGKLRQALEIANTNKVDAIVQVGDWFDVPEPSREFMAKTIRVLAETDHPPIYAIHGNHDMKYHTQSFKRRSGLRILDATKELTLLDTPQEVGGVVLHGADWGVTPDVLEQDGKKHVLVAHVMVGDKPLFPGHDITGPEQYERKHPGYALYAVGDYHHPFSTENCVNAGAMIRAEIDMIDHKPKVVIVDLDTNEFTDVYLEVTEGSVAFDESKKEERKEPDVGIQQFISKLQDAGQVGIDFSDNLTQYFAVNEEPQPVQDEIWEAMEKKG